MEKKKCRYEIGYVLRCGDIEGEKGLVIVYYIQNVTLHYISSFQTPLAPNLHQWCINNYMLYKNTLCLYESIIKRLVPWCLLSGNSREQTPLHLSRRSERDQPDSCFRESDREVAHEVRHKRKDEVPVVARHVRSIDEERIRVADAPGAVQDEHQIHQVSTAR